MENQQYLETQGVPQEMWADCLNAMSKYGDNHWWETETDLRKMAYYQTHEEIYLCHPKILGKALETLLGRPVYGPMTEMHPANLSFLQDEARRAWEQGTPVYGNDEIADIHYRLFACMQGWGTDVIAVEIPS